jgi:chitinase
LENNKNIVIVTPIIPLYWYNSGGDNQWNTLTGNWWTDINHTIQVSSLPNSSNSIIIT